jgi:hypothetical protein
VGENPTRVITPQLASWPRTKRHRSSIVKAIVEGHGGTLQVSSKEGAGTTFRVELPNGTPAGPRATAPAPALEA